MYSFNSSDKIGIVSERMRLQRMPQTKFTVCIDIQSKAISLILSYFIQFILKIIQH